MCKMASLYWDIPQFVFWAPFFGFDSVALGRSYDKTDRWKTETHHSTNRAYSLKWCMYSSIPCVQEAIIIYIHIVICMNESRDSVRQLHIWEWEPAYHLGDDSSRRYYFCGERKYCWFLPVCVLILAKYWWFLPVCVQSLQNVGGFFLFVFKACKMLVGSACLCSKLAKCWWFLLVCVQSLQNVGRFFLFVGWWFLSVCVQCLQIVGGFFLLVSKAYKMLVNTFCLCSRLA